MKQKVTSRKGRIPSIRYVRPAWYVSLCCGPQENYETKVFYEEAQANSFLLSSGREFGQLVRLNKDAQAFVDDCKLHPVLELYEEWPVAVDLIPSAIYSPATTYLWDGALRVVLVAKRHQFIKRYFARSHRDWYPWWGLKYNSMMANEEVVVRSADSRRTIASLLEERWPRVFAISEV
jgi:hypothetical protein